MNFASLKVEALAIHLIQQSTKRAPAAPILSEALTPLNDQNTGFLQERFKETLKKSREVAEDPDTSSSVPDAVRGLLLDGTDLLETSRALAKLLQESQAGISPPGLLLVARGQLAGGPVLVIAKWEHERGARTKQVQNSDGKLVYDMEFLNDLFMTEGSRVYKVAIFPSADVTKNQIRGQVVDRQSSGAAVAHYFRVDFLGCDFTLQPEVLTERFHDGAQSFIDTVEPPEKRARYQVALISELTSQRPELSVGDFARDYIDIEDRDAFRDHMGSRAVPLTSNLPKDLNLVKTRLRRVQIDFKHGTLVLAPPEEVGEGGHVTITSDGKTANVSISDEVVNISGRGAVQNSEAKSDGT